MNYVLLSQYILFLIRAKWGCLAVKAHEPANHSNLT